MNAASISGHYASRTARWQHLQAMNFLKETLRSSEDTLELLAACSNEFFIKSYDVCHILVPSSNSARDARFQDD